jgi:hypothetical protein
MNAYIVVQLEDDVAGGSAYRWKPCRDDTRGREVVRCDGAMIKEDKKMGEETDGDDGRQRRRE